MPSVCPEDLRSHVDLAIEDAWELRARIFKTQLIAKQLGRDDLDATFETLWYGLQWIIEKLNRVYDDLWKE